MGIKSLGRSLVFSALFLLIAVPVLPQDYEDDDEPNNTASLTVSVLRDGNAQITYSHLVPITEVESLRAALATATGCPASAFTLPQPQAVSSRIKDPAIRQRIEAANLRESQSTLTAHCAGLVKSEGFRRTVRLDTAPLQTILAAESAEWLWVSIYHPELGSQVQSPTYAFAQYQTASSYASYRIPVGGAPAPTSVGWGFDRGDFLKFGAILSAFMFVPVAICFWVRRKALTLGTTDPTAAWFSYFRTVNLCTNAVFLFWMLAGGNSRQGMVGLIEMLAGTHRNVSIVATLALTILPPWIVYFVCLSGSYRVLVQIRGIEWRFREFLLVQFLTVSALLVPIATLVSGLQIWHVSSRAAVIVFVVGWVLTILCARLKVKFAKTQPEPLTTGELRDRIFELAHRAGITLKHIFVMPAGKMQVANAYAAANQAVTFTDYVLHRLNKREVDAVAAHELSHLRHKHPAKLLFALLGAIFLPSILPPIVSTAFTLGARIFMEATHNYTFYGRALLLMNRVWKSPIADPAILAIGLLGFYYFARRFERTADEGAVHLTNDPEALITGLLKLNRLNLMPFQWSKRTGIFLTHPSTMKRVERIAATGNVAPERVQQLLSEFSSDSAVPDPADYYLVPDLSKERVVTTAEQVQKSQTNLLLLLAAHVVPPTVFAWIAQRTAFGNAHRFGVLFFGAFATVGGYYVFSRILALRGRSKLQAKFEQKFRREGLLLDYSKARVVGFAPGPHPRFYVTSWNWDTGLLILRRGCLIFLGDQVRFRIPVEQISRMWLGQGAPSLHPVKRIYMQLVDPQIDASEYFNFSCLDRCSPFGLAAQSSQLFEMIEHWRNHQQDYPNPPDDLLKLAAPSFGQVTCLTPDKLSNTRKEFTLAFLFLLLGWLAVSAARIDGLFYVVTVIALLRLYEFLPYRFYRDRSPDGTPIRSTPPPPAPTPLPVPRIG